MVLAVPVTTSLDYTHHPTSQGLGPLGRAVRQIAMLVGVRGRREWGTGRADAVAGRDAGYGLCCPCPAVGAPVQAEHDFRAQLSPVGEGPGIREAPARHPCSGAQGRAQVLLEALLDAAPRLRDLMVGQVAVA